ncbi:LacI family DNA-binding transcriptional regulator [Kribbella sp. NPDC004875]|uniref:LacI family DNA-binding transcriptional regulator n=1 Tax=Kribbella sp. NPDC004875 TaxID=3364107 RepID=UPI00367B7BB4
MVTLRDIAEQAGVSVSSVSLVLNDRDRGRIRADVAERIRELAAELGYVPNLLARGLKTKQSLTIGLVSDGVASIPFATEMLAGAQLAAADDGFLLMLIDTVGHPEVEGPATRALLQRNIEALIVAAEFHRDVDVPLVPNSLPAVVLDGRPKDPGSRADWVVPDEVGGARAATERLIAAGHRRVAFCNVADPMFVARVLRRTGYEKAMRAAGLAVDEALIVEAADPSAAAGRSAALKLLRRPDRPTAVFCFSDQIAMGFYQVAQQLGLEIPRDLSIVGFDNHQFVAESMLPGLTTVQLPHRAMGKWAAQQAIARSRGATDSAPTHRLMPCPVIERSSVAPPGTGSD